MALFEQLREAIAGTFKVSPAEIAETTRDEDLAGWDSLGHINLMMTLEQTFGISLEVEDFARLNSVPRIVEYLRERGIGGPTTPR